MRLELEVNAPGRYRVTGDVHAADLSGNAFSMPFAFQVLVAQLGHRYQVPIPEQTLSLREEKNRSERESILNLNTLAMQYYSYLLSKTEDGGSDHPVHH